MALAILLLAALAGVLLRHHAPRWAVRAASLLQVVGLAIAGLEAASCLGGSGNDEPIVGIAYPWPVLHRLPGMQLDALGAILVLALAVVGIPVALYAPSYLEGKHQRLSGPWQQALVAVLEGSILVVASASNAFVLLFGWEAMTAAATALILADGQSPEVRRAGVLYAVMSHVGTLLGILAILIIAREAATLAKTPLDLAALDYEKLRLAARSLSPQAHAAVLLLGLVGLGTKAGIVPLHVWLPEAHPAAPSHVSALLSGVIVKCGIYGVARLTLDLAGPAPLWFGIVLMGVGLASALLGVLYTLMEHDLKRLLAFCTIENVGIVFLGLGTGVAATRAGRGLETIASLAVAAALFHVVNHAVFKALLFLCAGSVHSRIHDRNLEEMGGLLRKMPQTALAFLVGALAISGMPPLNGFASEWSLLQSLVGCMRAADPTLRRLAPLFVAGFSLTGALAAAAFVKAFGIAFLGLPRSEHARHASEVAAPQRIAQGMLALACVALGVLSPVALVLAARGGEPLSVLPYLGIDPYPGSEQAGSIGAKGAASASPVALLLSVSAIAIVLALLTRRARASARSAEPWVCGLERVEPRMQYTASAFTKALRLVFRNLFRPSRELTATEGRPPYYVKRWKTSGSILPIFERFIYDPIVWSVERAARAVQGAASPSVEAGLFLTLVAFVLAIWWAL